jgi:hypothetical protein
MLQLVTLHQSDSLTHYYYSERQLNAVLRSSDAGE